MKINRGIKTKKRPQMWWLIWTIILLPFLFAVMNELLMLPWAVRYLLDAAWIVLLVAMLGSIQKRNKRLRWIVLWVVVFLAYTLASYLPQFQSALYYLWGVRNNFRVYVAFFAFAYFMTQQDAEDFLEVLDKLFWLNAVISVVQYFGFGLEGDYLGGIFGSKKGGNGYTNIFFCIIIIKSILGYLEKKETTAACVAKFVTAMLVAALAELKFFFIEAVLIILLAVLVTNFTWRKLWLIVGGVVAVVAGIALLSVVFPSYAGWFTVESMLDSAFSDKGYTSAGDLNRLNAIFRINELWLKDSVQQLFGMGLGNCDTASVEFLNTPFYEKNHSMHYTWISYAHMYLECGWIGLIFYIGFFVLLYFCAYRISKHGKGMKVTYGRISMIMAIMCVVISVYNSTLRTEAGYMAYFVLALPFVTEQKTQQAKRDMNEPINIENGRLET